MAAQIHASLPFQSKEIHFYGEKNKNKVLDKRLRLPWIYMNDHRVCYEFMVFARGYLKSITLCVTFFKLLLYSFWAYRENRHFFSCPGNIDDEIFHLKFSSKKRINHIILSNTDRFLSNQCIIQILRVDFPVFVFQGVFL